MNPEMVTTLGGLMVISAPILVFCTPHIFAKGKTADAERVQRKKRGWFVAFTAVLLLVGFFLMG